VNTGKWSDGDQWVQETAGDDRSLQKKQYKTTRSVNQGKGQLRRKIKSCKNFKATDCLRFKETNAKLTV